MYILFLRLIWLQLFKKYLIVDLIQNFLEILILAFLMQIIYSKLLLLIELNDESHNIAHRKKRDIKVHDICNKASIKLITFYTKYSNEKEYVKNRIIKEINILRADD